MRKSMKQRVALFLSFAMAFTSVDSSALVAAADMTEIVSQETQLEDAVQEEGAVQNEEVSADELAVAENEEAQPEESAITDELVEETEVIDEEAIDGDGDQLNVMSEDIGQEEGEQVIDAETEIVLEQNDVEAGQTDASDMAAPESLMAESVTAEELLNADLSTLELGENQITSGENGFNWYKFEAVKGRKYNIDPCATVQMYYIENGEIAEAAPNNVFRAEHTGTYYLGFWGPVYNSKTDDYDLYTFTTNISEIPLIEDITVGEIQNRNIISEFQITMGYGTEYTIDYNNGTSETVKVDDDSYTDQYGNTVQYIYRRKDDNSDTEYKYNDKKPAGDYTIQFCVKGDVLETTGWEYTSVNAQDAELPSLNTGENEIISGENDYNWYRFEAVEDKKYAIDQWSNMLIYTAVDNEMVAVSYNANGLFKAEQSGTYYLGFQSALNNEDTGNEDVYSWTANISEVVEVKNITVDELKNTSEISGLQHKMGIGTKYTIEYTNGDSETVVLDGGSYTDTYGNTIRSYFVRENSSYSYDYDSEKPVGNYALLFWANDGEKGRTDYIFTSVDADEAGLPDLSVGENEITSGENDYNWYRFEVAEGTRYHIDRYNDLEVYTKENDSMTYVSTSNGSFKATKSGTYYIGFQGAIWDGNTGTAEYDRTVNVLEAAEISTITVGELQNQTIIAGLQSALGGGTEYTIEYTNGESATAKIDDGSYEDAYGNQIIYRYKQEGNEGREYYYGEHKPVGRYTIVFEVDGQEAASTDYVFTSVDVDTVNLPTLVLGENEITSGEYDYNWYQFEAEQGMKYQIDREAGFAVYTKDEDGNLTDVKTGYGSFEAAKNGTYYLGFQGAVWDDGEQYSWTATLMKVTRITKITIGEPQTTTIISGLQRYMGIGTEYTIEYVSGESVKVKITDDSYTDAYGNTVVPRYKDQDGNVYYAYDEKPGGRSYALALYVDGEEIASTGYVFTSVDVDKVNLPTFVLGENEITSGEHDYNWYQFEVEAGKKYYIDRTYNFSLYTKAEDGKLVVVPVSYDTFKATKNGIYYLGFQGGIWNEDTGEDDLYTWTANISEVTEIESITVGTLRGTRVIADLDPYGQIGGGTEFTINYADQESEQGTIDNGIYRDKYGNSVEFRFYAKDAEDPSEYYGYLQEKPAGLYKLAFYLNDEELASVEDWFEITKAENVEFPELVKGQNEIQSEKDSYYWYQFQAEADTRYRIDRCNSLRVYTKTDDGMTSVDVNGDHFKTAQAGIYYLGFRYGVQDDDGNTVYTWMASLTSTSNVSDVLVEPGKTQFYQDEYPVSLNSVQFTYADETTRLFNDGMNFSDMDGQGNGVRVFLTSENSKEKIEPDRNLAAGTYIVHVQLIDDENVEDTYTITILQEDTPFNGLAEITELQLGESYPVELDAEKRAQWFSYTPEREMSVTFWSSDREDYGSFDTYGELYNAEGKLLVSDDEGASDNNFLVAYMLEAGETYYFKARMFGVGQKGTFKVSLNEKTEIAGIESVTPDQEQYLAGLDNRISAGSHVVLKYKNGETSEKEINDLFLWDEHGYNLSFQLKDAEGNVFGYWDYLPEGKYALVIYVNGVEAASSEPVYNVVDRSKAEKLEPGEVTLESGREEYRPHWYRFIAEETGKYCFQQSPQMKVIYFQEDTKEEEDTGRGSLRAKAGETYYIGFSGYVYNEDEEEVYTWTTQLERKPAVTDIQATPVKSTFYEDRYENEYARFTLQFTYDDGSSASFASWRKYYDVDGKGNGINVYLTRKGDESGEIYDTSGNFPVGTYIVHVEMQDYASVADTYEITIEEQPSPFNGKVNATEMEPGKSYVVKIDEDHPSGWFSFTLQEDMETIFCSTGKYDTYGYIYNAQGEIVAEDDDGYNNGNFAVQQKLTAGETYYFRARMYSSTRNGSFMVSLREKQPIQELEVAEHDLKNRYLEEYFSYPTVLVKAVYKDGSSEMFYAGENDGYGNRVSIEMLDASGTVLEDVWEVGTYTCQVRYGEAEDQTVTVGTFRIVPMEEMADQIIEEDQELQLDASQDQKMSYQFTAKEAGLYQIRANVPFRNLSVYDGEKKRVKRFTYRNGYTVYASLQPGTYYVIADVGDDVTKLKVSVTKTVLPEKVSAVYRGNSGGTILIEGLDRLYRDDLNTKVNYNDNTTAWIYGKHTDSYGNQYDYSIQDQSGREWSSGDRLPAGTYTVKPVVFRTGTSIRDEEAPDNQMLNKVLTEENKIPTTVAVQKLDLSSLTPVTLNQEVNVTGKNGRYFYSFTPEETGRYQIVQKDGRAEFVSYEEDDMLDYYGDSMYLTAGLTCGIDVEKRGDVSFQIVKQTAEPDPEPGEDTKKAVQRIEVKTDAGYLVYTKRNSNYDEMYMQVTYKDGTTKNYHLWNQDLEDTYDYEDDYGNSFRIQTEETIREDGTYLKIDVSCGEETASTEIEVKTVEELAIEVSTENPVKADGVQYFRFTAPESGKYAFRVQSKNRYLSFNNVDYELDFDSESGRSEGEDQAYQVTASLRKGKTYYFGIRFEYYDAVIDNADESYTVAVLKPGKQISDLRITKVPENVTAWKGIGVEDFGGIEAEVTYADDTKETVTYGPWTDSGRTLEMVNAYWLNTETYRIFMQYGSYRAYIDLPAAEWKYDGELKTAVATKVSSDSYLKKYSFTPAKTESYRFNISGLLYGYAIEVYDAETSIIARENYGVYALEAGKTYNVAVYCYDLSGNTFTIVPNVDGEEIAEHDHNYVDDVQQPTCTEPGYTQKVCSICGEVLKGSYEEIPATGHGLTKTEEKEATCTENGNKAYWICQICGKVYADENGTTETTVKEQQIIALGHRLAKTEAREATCTENGNKAYWTCQICEKVFADDQGTTETTVEEQVIAATGHKLTETEEKAATCEEAGNHAYWTCGTCKKIFADAEGTIETTAEEQVIAATGHKLFKTEAKEATCTENGNKAYWTCRSCERVFADDQGTTKTTVEEQVIAATGHKLTKTESKAATCEEAGNNEYWTCENCGKVFADEEGKKATTTAAETISPLGHAWDVRITRPATDTEEGIQETYCTRCNTVQKTETIPMLGHRMGDWIITKEPTCTEAGSQYRECVYDKCTICTDGSRYRQEEVIPATGHELKMVDEKAATCTKAGNEAYWICQTCGKVYADAGAQTETTIKDQVINAAGHKYGDWKTTKDAECELDGEMTRTCQVCGNTEKTDIPATGHHYVSERLEPTCTSAGYVREKCTDCEKVKDGSYKRLASLGHDYDDWVVVKKVTCTDSGEMTRTCRRCGYVFRSIVNVTGHWYDDEAKEATCTEAGYTQEKCRFCGDIRNPKEIPATGHQTVKERHPATCTVDGYSRTVCTVCGTVTDYQFLPATGHQYDDAWTVEKAATCTEEGTESRTCKNCDNKESRVIPKTDHTWVKDIVKEATATEEGLEREICRDCKEERPGSRMVIPKTEHQMGDWTVTKEATCTEAGIRTRKCEYDKCTLCNGVPYEQTESIPALGHDWNNVETKATCIKAGFVQQICKTCGEKGERIEIPATGHSFGAGVYVTEPTCTSQGLIEFTCESCDAKRFGILPKSRHIWNTEPTIEKAATCTEEGLQDIRCSICNEVNEASVKKIPAAGHSWNEKATIDRQPTCTEIGQKSIHCAECDAVRPNSETEIPAAGHDYVTSETAATCTVPGTRTSQCKVCGNTETVTIPVTGHKMQLDMSLSVMRTCTSDGLLVYVCQNAGCGQRSYVVNSAYEAHDWGEEENKPATDTENGKRYQICKRCGEEKVLEILLRESQQELIDLVQKGNITAILDVDNEVLLSDTHKDLIQDVEEKIISDGVNGKTYRPTTISGNMADKNSSVTGAAITAAAEEMKKEPEVSTLALDDTASQEENSNNVTSNVEVSRTSEEILDTKTGKYYFNMSLSMTVNGKKVVSLEKPVTVKVTVPENFKGTNCILRSDNGTEQNVTAQADGTLIFTTETLGSKQLIKVSCTGEHEFKESSEEPATCTEPKKISRTCKKCNYVKEEREGKPADHNYVVDEGTVKEATCIEKGSRTLKCQNCDSEITQTIPVTGHSYTKWRVEKEATCTTKGSKTRSCTTAGCKEEEVQTIPATGHTFAKTYKVDKKATCTEAGTESRHCVNCDASTDTRTIKATGHRFDESKAQWNVDNSNCLQTGTVQCDNCNAVKQISRSVNHTLQKTEAKEATCTEAGSKEYWICENCKTVFEDAAGTKETTVEAQITPAAGHNLKKTEAKEATCTETGNDAYWTCGTCGKVYADEAATTETTVEKQIIPVKAHNLKKTEAKEATCTGTGNRAYWTCGTCGKVYADVNGSQETTVAAQMISAKGHSLVETAAKDATCTTVGNRVYWTCTTCQKIYANASGTKETTIAAQNIPATGNHSFGDFTVTKEATIFEKGTETRTCTVCGTAESRETAKIPGTIKLTVNKVPLQIKKSVNLSRIVTGLSQGDYIVACTTSNAKVATVNNKGKVTGKAVGTAKITIRLRSGTTATVAVSVQKKVVTTTSIKNLTRALKMNLKEKKQLYPVISPISTTDKVTYKSSDKKVVTVSAKGKLTAKKAGKAKITVQSGKKKFMITVTVTAPAPTGMKNVPKSKALKKGKTFVLKPTLLPTGAKGKITYKTSNKKVVTVDARGKVTAKGKGSAVIIVTAGKVKKTCKVTVK